MVRRRGALPGWSAVASALFASQGFEREEDDPLAGGLGLGVRLGSAAALGTARADLAVAEAEGADRLAGHHEEGEGHEGEGEKVLRPEGHVGFGFYVTP